MKNPEQDGIVAGSFRDPSGHLFHRYGVLYRQVNQVYRENYDLLLQSGLYARLVASGSLIKHEETDIQGTTPAVAYKVIRPEAIDFISYPYEWCFSQLKHAALLTLEIQRISLDHGMTLKDASAYNVQFNRGKPVFIDTLSFERYREGQPWVAYRQFCQHFVAPLALMSRRDIRLGQLLRIYMDGIPLDLASSLLPAGTHFSLPLLAHIHLHARSQSHYAGKQVDVRSLKLSRHGLYGIIDQLTHFIRGLSWRPAGTAWAGYYTDHNYSPAAFTHKQEIVAGFIESLKPVNVWDLGANTGVFSRLAGARGIPTISFDLDPAAVELNYLTCVKETETYILPLVIDLANPSPGLGWENNERMSLARRGPTDALLALALVHHMAISNNLPLNRIASFLRDMGKSLIIEFVPKTDSQVQRMLAAREDIFIDYTQHGFEQAFLKYFIVDDCEPIKGSQRLLYLMRAR